MFGYVRINKPELKVKDYNKYKAYYCGLCRTLKERYGRFGQMTLTYDMTFLIILLTSLYESDTKAEQHRCMVQPKKHPMLLNEITEYVADMNIALTYHHFRDDWQDEKSIAGLAGAGVLKGKYKKIFSKYPRQCEAICKCLEQLQTYEQNNEKEIDKVAGCFGEIMAEIFVYRQDRWEESLRKAGFYLGKYIYIIDAYDDLDKDRKQNSYNPFSEICETDTFEEECRNMLTMMIAATTAELERLPCVQDIDILRNILYEGIWSAYDAIQIKKNNSNSNNETKLDK
jgi:hypothetical protein